LLRAIMVRPIMANKDLIAAKSSQRHAAHLPVPARIETALTGAPVRAIIVIATQ
jgi:hypothetical protein